MSEPMPHKKKPRAIKSHDLGHIIDYYPTKNYRLKRWLPLIAGVFAILAAIGLLFNLFIVTRTAIQAHGPAVLISIIPMPTILYALLLVVGIFLVIQARIHWWDCLTLFENGIIKEKGNKQQVWHYHDTVYFDNAITQIMFGGSMIGGRLKILLEDGSKRRFLIRNRYTRMEDLVNTLRSRVIPGLFQRAHQTLRDGQILHFGQNLKANEKGLDIDKETISFDSITTEISKSSIKLLSVSNPKKLLIKLKINKIRNLDLLLDLIENPPTQTD